MEQVEGIGEALGAVRRVVDAGDELGGWVIQLVGEFGGAFAELAQLGDRVRVQRSVDHLLGLRVYNRDAGLVLQLAQAGDQVAGCRAANVFQIRDGLVDRGVDALVRGLDLLQLVADAGHLVHTGGHGGGTGAQGIHAVAQAAHAVGQGVGALGGLAQAVVKPVGATVELVGAIVELHDAVDKLGRPSIVGMKPLVLFSVTLIFAG